MTVWSNGGRRRSGASRARASYGPSAAQLQRQAAAIARTQAEEDKLARIRELVDLQHELVSAHLEQFVDSTRPVVDQPSWVYPQQYLPEIEKRHLAGVGRFDRVGREAARLAAAGEAEQAAAAYNARLQAEHVDAQARADAWWAALLVNDETTVIATVNDGFADNASVAAALSVDRSALTVLMIQPTADDLGEQKATLTTAGKPTIARMTKTEQRQLWTACTLSRAIATIAEAFALASALERVNIAVVSQRLASSTRYSLVLAGEAPRQLFRSARWPAQVAARDLALGGNFLFDLDRFGALAEIPTANDPQLRALVDGINGVIEQDSDTGAAPQNEPRQLPSPPKPMATTPSAPPAAAASSPTTSERPRPAPVVAQSRENPAIVEASNSPTVMPEGRPFELWVQGAGYGSIDIKGTQHRQDALLSLLPRANLAEGADLDTSAQLIPEPTNPFDSNAVGCWVQGRLIGYLPRAEAARYAEPLAQLVRAGRLPTTTAHLWGREFTDYDYSDNARPATTSYVTSARVALSEPDLLAPVNLAPPKPRIEIPVGPAAKITGTQDNLPHLLRVLGPRPTAWAYGTLEPRTITTARTAKTVVEVQINGQPSGTLSPQMSTGYLPVVAPLHEAGCRVTVRVLLTGSPVSVAATIYATRAHEIPRDWFTHIRAELGISFGAE